MDFSANPGISQIVQNKYVIFCMFLNVADCVGHLKFTVAKGHAPLLCIEYNIGVPDAKIPQNYSVLHSIPNSFNTTPMGLVPGPGNG